ncbi:hypothetical protein Daesc_005839 [Daldinia eschscholtzii]|uniref:NACHT domain-containing protein n=1 Tax=Daldinia eschscholtzii TaxID=292717 RepID=A0AAX6MM21_9PEZI
MEALAALGLACNILQLIECGYKAVVMAKELHGSRQDAIDSNANTEFVAREMRELSLRVMKDLPASGLTEDETALCRLAQQCSDLSNRLLALLESLKTKRRGSKLDIVTTVLRNMRKKHELEQLQASLDNHRKQLQVHMNNVSHSDLAQKLENTLITTSMSRTEILHLRDQVLKLQNQVVINSNTMVAFFHKLQRAVEVPLKQAAILQSLRYPRMNDRFDNVETAHQKTFEWLLQGPEHTLAPGKESYTSEDDPALTGPDANITSNQAKYQQHREFIAWLQGELDHSDRNTPSKSVAPDRPSEKNIFHILGKPGAGKSTLMKFLCENDITHKHLKVWAGEKRLIISKAFFWRLGDDEQKSQTGLITCLLHQLLKAAPELTKIAFPSEWESDYERTIFLDPSVLRAFNNVFGDPSTLTKYKIIFFIDGLDEFEGHPIGLVDNIVRWTKLHPGNLKICVSSRPWNEFKYGFREYRSLIIHEWTRDDIRTFITDRFEKLSDMSPLVSQQGLNSLAESIVEKAEGVFLWVRVVIAAIEQGIINGDELRDLRRKVNAFPRELNDLYQHLLDSIPEYDRQKASRFLNLTLDIGLESPVPLLQYKFLNDVSEDPNFAIKLPAQLLPDSEIQRLLDIADRQVNGLCKGFLEICSTEQATHTCIKGVRFMHGSAVEFLRRNPKLFKPYLGEIDAIDLTCQSFLAFLKSAGADEFFASRTRDESSSHHECEFISQFYRIIEAYQINHSSYCDTEYGAVTRRRFFAFLDNVEQLAIPLLQEGLKQEREIRLENSISIVSASDHRTSGLSLRNAIHVPLTQLISVLVARLLLFEYFDDDGRCNLQTQTDPEFRKRIVKAVLSKISWGRFNDPRAFKMLETIFKGGISPNTPYEVTYREESILEGDDLWTWTLQRIIFVVTEPRSRSEAQEASKWRFQYKTIELCLRYGASEDFTLRFGPCYEKIGSGRLLVRVHAADSKGQVRDSTIDQHYVIYVDYQLNIVRYAREKGGVLTLRDLLAYCFPRHYDYLCSLLDKKQPSSLETNDMIETPDSQLPGMPVLFPEEHRCFEFRENIGQADWFDSGRVPEGYRECLSHSEKCFRDFEAKLQKSD